MTRYQEFLSVQSHLYLSGSKQSQCEGEFISEEINNGGGFHGHTKVGKQLGKGRFVQIMGDLGLAV